MKRYNPKEIKKLVANLAARVEVPAEDARIFADSLVEADVQGTSTHGVSRAGIYIRRIQEGLIAPNARLSLEQRRDAVLSVDAGNGLGQVQAVKVLERLLPLARKHGVASATIANSQHFGALSYFCNRAADENMILFATTNVEPSMSPTGSGQAYFGTNPIGISFPTGKGFHIKVDLATSITARGNIIAAHKKGEAIHEGWALDVDGNPTTDAGKALLGTVLTMAGHKGYALALMAEVLAGTLSGAAMGYNVGSMYKDMDRTQDVGHFFFLADIDAFMDVETFKARIDTMIDEIKACRKRPGTGEILVPGERSHRTARINRSRGIAIGDETAGELKTLCRELQVPCPL